MYAAVEKISRRDGTPEDGATKSPRGAVHVHSLAVIDDLMAGGEMLPAQLPSATNWSPEKKLTAAVLASALVEIRDHYGSRAHRHRVAEALEWVQADDSAWPFSFLRLCALFELEVDWVRAAVQRWMGTPREERKAVNFLYRQAA